MFYAATNSYASSVSMGFDNTWSVLAFNSKKSRDAFVDNASDMATKAIKRDRATYYATNYCVSSNKTNAPRPFSGEHWAIMDLNVNYDGVEGYVGEVVCASSDDILMSYYVKKFY